MTDENEEFHAILAEVRSLTPPKRHNKHDPRYQAQKALHAMAHGQAVEFPEAVWRAIPPMIKLFELRAIHIGRNTFVHGLRSNTQAVGSVRAFLKRNGWGYRAPCKPPTRGRDNRNKKGGHYG